MSPRQRFFAMAAATGAAFLTALIAIVAAVSFGEPWGQPLFVAAILTGFGAQIWFVVGLARAARLEKGV